MCCRHTMLNSVIETVWVPEGRMPASPDVNDSVGNSCQVHVHFSLTKGTSWLTFLANMKIFWRIQNIQYCSNTNNTVYFVYVLNTSGWQTFNKNILNPFSVQCRRCFFWGGGVELVLYALKPTRTIFELRIADIVWTGRRIDHSEHSFDQS